MIDPQDIDIDASIRTGWLKGKFPLADRMETFVWVGISGAALLVSLYLIYVGVQFPSLRMATGAGILLAVICTFMVYRSIVLNKFQKLDTMLLAPEIKNQLLNYSTANKYLIEFKSDRLLIVHDPGPVAYLRRGKPTKLIYVLIENNVAHFCISGGDPESLRAPVVMAHWWLKRDLQKILV